MQRLHKALQDGLDSGLAINEIKEVLVHLYAYCGFSRSLQGIDTFMVVLEARRAKGITDKAGKEATPVKSSRSKYERGKKALETLCGQKNIFKPLFHWQEQQPKSKVFAKTGCRAMSFIYNVSAVNLRSSMCSSS